MKRYLIAALLFIPCAAFAQTAPKSPALTEYLANTKSPVRNLALANGASQCGYRSDRWLNMFNDGYQTMTRGEINRLGLTGEEITIADQENEKVYREAIASTSCTKLSNSPELAHLDAIVKALTSTPH